MYGATRGNQSARDVASWYEGGGARAIVRRLVGLLVMMM